MASADLNFSYKGNTFVSNVKVGDYFWIRLMGYMFKSKPHVPGILFVPAGALQTTFMRFNLDLAFLSEKNEVLKIVRDLKPWRQALSISKAKKVLEVPAGCLPPDLKVGDILDVTNS